MSDNIPFEIQEEIMKKLPVQSLIQFRSVSKTWKSLIDSTDFVNHYSNQQQQQQHLLVRYKLNSVEKYVSIADDDTFPHLRVPLTLPLCAKMLEYYSIIGSSHGLLCLHGSVSGISRAVLWNPSLRKAASFVVPDMVGDSNIYGTTLGFGVCCETNDPKLVKITYIIRDEGMENISSIPQQVEVFTLSTGAWRTPYSTRKLPRKSIIFDWWPVVVNGFLYWRATDRSTIDVELEVYNLIISFDMTSEEFRDVNLPADLVYEGCMHDLYISNLRESLVVLRHIEPWDAFDVWLMEDGVSKPFTKLFTIYSPNATIYRVLEFRKSGEPIIEVEHNDSDSPDDPSLLVVYEPKSKYICNLGINGTGSYYVHSYKETLLLHNQPVFDGY